MSTIGKVIVTIIVGIIAAVIIAIIPWKIPSTVVCGGLYSGFLKNVWAK